jgi:hypothetical protein
MEMLQDITKCCYRRRWYSFDELKSVVHELVAAEYRDAGDDEIPS